MDRVMDNDMELLLQFLDDIVAIKEKCFIPRDVRGNTIKEISKFVTDCKHYRNIYLNICLIVKSS